MRFRSSWVHYLLRCTLLWFPHWGIIPWTTKSKEHVNGELLDKGANINHQDGEGKNPLIHSVDPSGSGEYLITKELLYRGADPYTEDKNGNTFFDYMDKEDQNNVKKYMERNIPINIKSAKY